MTEHAEQQPHEWDEPTWRGIVEKVRAGEGHPRGVWPGGAKVAVAISYDADHETPLLRDNITSPGNMSGGQYGSRVAMPRILDLHERYEVPASFFIPAVSALLYPDDVKAMVDGGHEIAAHGWIHERTTLLEPAVERDLTLRSLDTLEQLAGRRPVGMRTPSWDFSDATLDIVLEAGLLYDSSLMADDDPYELVAEGKRTGLVEIPVEWIRDDAPYFVMSRFGGLRPHTEPDAVKRIWIAEFDRAYAEGGVFQVTMHPSISGHRSRIGVIEGVLDHIREVTNGDVWYATHEQLALHVKETLGL